MKSFINYNSMGLAAHFKFIGILFIAIASVCLLSSCEKDDLEIQKGSPFEVSVMPVPIAIANGQTIEIRLTIQRTEHYKSTQYFIRYFQYDGLGLLRYDQQHAFVPNNLYPVPAEQFRLYYTSQSFVSHSFTVWISDNLGNEKQVNFELNSINR